MTANGIRMGDAYISLGVNDETSKGLQRAASNLASTGQQVLSATARIAAVWSAVAGGIALAVYQTGKYEAALLRIRMVYTNLEQAQLQWMGRFKSLSMRGKLQIADMISTFGAFTKGLGFANDESMILARGLALVSSNMSTFAGISLEESAQRFRSAMAGSSEVLDMLGINIKEAALNQELLAMGFPSISNGAAESQKVLARYSIILKSMRKQGSLFADATMNTMPRSIEIFKGAVSDMLVTIGAPFMEFAMNLINFFTTIVKLLTRMSKYIKYVTGAIGIAMTAIAVYAGSLMLMGAALIFVSAVLANYSRLQGISTAATNAGTAAIARYTIMVMRFGSKLSLIVTLIAAVIAALVTLAYGLDDAIMKSTEFSMAMGNMWDSAKKGNWKDAWDSLFDGGILTFKRLALGFGDIIGQMIDGMLSMWYRGLAEMNRSFNNMLRPFKTFLRDSFFGDIMPEEMRKRSDAIADQLQSDLDKTAHEWSTGGNSIQTNDSQWARDRTALAKDIERIEARISKRNEATSEDRKRLAEEELAAQQENLNKMIAKYKGMAGSLKSAALQAPQALTYRSVEGQRAAYQNQLGMLDRLSKLVEVNQQNEDNTRKTNFELQQLRSQLQAVQ